MINGATEFLRYPVLGEQRTAVPLREELAAVRYLDIEAISFDGRLRVTIDADPRWTTGGRRWSCIRWSRTP